MSKHRRKRRRDLRRNAYLLIILAVVLIFFTYRMKSGAPPVRSRAVQKPLTARKFTRPKLNTANVRILVISEDASISMPGIPVGIGKKYLTTDEAGVVQAEGIKAGRTQITSRAADHVIYDQSHFLRSGENTMTIALKPETVEAEIDSANNRPKVYLTIDDGPTQRYTPKVLDILKKEQVPATFFIVGRRAARRPEIVRRIYLEGHTVGNHTYSHNYQQLYRGSSRNLIASFYRLKQLTKEILGGATMIVRPPGGKVGNFRRGWQRSVNAAGYTTVLWNVSTGDGSTSTTSPQMVANTIRYLDKLEPGEPAVILMHDVRAPIAKALPKIIAELRRRELEFAVVNEDTREPGLILGPWRSGRRS